MQKFAEINPEKSCEQFNLEEIRREEIRKRTMKYLGRTLSQNNNEKKDLYYNVNILNKGIIVSISGRKNRDSVINWMENHMEAYPETIEGFKVKFIDDSKTSGYLVKLCEDSNEEYDIEIGGNRYKITSYIDRSYLNNTPDFSNKNNYNKRMIKKYKSSGKEYKNYYNPFSDK